MEIKFLGPLKMPKWVLRLIFVLLTAHCSLLTVSAQEATFSQKIEWKSNANALEYRVEVQNTETGRTQTIKTEKTSTELSLVPGKYRYRVYAYDFLGKQASVSSWTNFEVFKANKPKINSVEKNLSVTNDSNKIGIDVSIDDVNQNSKFELISEGLEGAIPYSDRSKMRNSASETDSVTHLDFSNVPPGKWRLRVTNASGLSTLSDVITVDGERTYTAEEVAQIKKDAETAKEAELRQEFQNNLDEYIRIAEAEKAAEAERQRIAAEEAKKARIAQEARQKAEREAAERARIAEEKRREEERIAAEKRREEERIAAEKARIAEEKRREEERIAEEKRIAEQNRQMELAKAEAEKRAKEEEKRLAKLAKKNQPYKWKDIVFQGGVGYSISLYDSSIREYYDNFMSPSLNVRLKWLPAKSSSTKFGFEANFLQQGFVVDNNYLSAKLISSEIDLKLVLQKKLVGSLFWSIKAGGGANRIEKSMEYSSLFTNRGSPDDKTYLYPSFAGGLSLYYIPWKCIVLEAGVDFYHVFLDSSKLGFIVPYACVGFRF